MYSSAPSKNFSNFWKGDLPLPNPGRGIGPQRKRCRALFCILWGKIWGLRLPKAPTTIPVCFFSSFSRCFSVFVVVFLLAALLVDRVFLFVGAFVSLFMLFFPFFCSFCLCCFPFSIFLYLFGCLFLVVCVPFS